MASGLVFDYQEPCQHLMAWFLSDSGIPNVRVTTARDAFLALRDRPRVIIVNSTAPAAEIAPVVAELRQRARGDVRIVVLHDGRHRPGQPSIEADICLHEVHDVDALVHAVQAALDDDVPEVEPHAAGEAVIEDAQDV
ncbi:MAG TPA: hypothetical protein VFC53_09065 [Dehalococcoidia bacterium]|nr:hypothetical protein [Dehalococcoidia bacterium]